MPLPPGYQPYQIQEQDKDMLTLAEQLGINFQQLQQANPSITSISQGQFINIPRTGVITGPALTPIPGSQFGNQVKNAWGGFVGYQPSSLTSTPLPYSAPVSGGMAGPSRAPQSINSPYYVPQNGNAYTLYQQQGQAQPTNQPLAMSGPYVSPGASVGYLQATLQNAKDPSQLPPSIAPNMVQAAGYTPEQMLKAGYVMKNGYWVNVGANGTGGWVSPTTGNVYNSSNNWETNPALHMVVVNRNAKNKNNRFVTTEKWAQNAYRRKKRAAKGIGTTQPGNDIRGDTPSTTLDLVLGS